MEVQAKRSPGGKLALWALYAFCGYCVWVIVRYWWVVGKIHSVPGASVEGDFGTTAGKWLGALLGMLVLGGMWLYSRRGRLVYASIPRRAGSSALKLLCSRLTLRKRKAYGPG